MSIWDSIIQGIIQGITEFLPVSSSGHLGLYQHFTGNNGEGSLFFSLMLHMGTLVAVFIVYRHTIGRMLKEIGFMGKEIYHKKFVLKTDNRYRRMVYMLILATLPLFLLLPIHKQAENIAQDDDIVVEGICFLLTAVLIFIATRPKDNSANHAVRTTNKNIMQMHPINAVTVGISQAVAVLPGLSRSGTTTSVGMMMGFERELAVEFSFLMGIPAILGGAILELKGAFQNGIDTSVSILLIGMLTSAVVGYLSIIMVKWFRRTNHYRIFAWYTLALGTAVVVIGIFEHLAGENFIKMLGF